jgi:hypothetical protein
LAKKNESQSQAYYRPGTDYPRGPCFGRVWDRSGQIYPVRDSEWDDGQPQAYIHEEAKKGRK